MRAARSISTAADTSAAALVAYGAGLPAFVLVRCVVPSFYARGDTATPVRATILSVLANIAMKLMLVWGVHLGVIGVALGTSIGAWVNFAVLTWLARRRAVLVVTPELKRAILPVLAAAGAAAAGLLAGVGCSAMRSPFPAGHFHDLCRRSCAGMLGAGLYAAVVIGLRRSLPLESAR